MKSEDLLELNERIEELEELLMEAMETWEELSLS